MAARPKKGDALLFYSLKPDGKTADMFSLHSACPVTKGTKWVAIKWIHTDPFRPEDLLVAVSACAGVWAWASTCAQGALRPAGGAWGRAAAARPSFATASPPPLVDQPTG